MVGKHLESLQIEQGRLFEISPTGVSVIPDTQPDSVNILERAILLGETLDFLLRANGLRGFSSSQDVTEKLGANYLRSQNGAQEKANHLRIAAKVPFRQAFGLQKLVDNPESLWTENKSRREAEIAFGDFYLGKGREADTAKTPAQIRKELARTIILQSTLLSEGTTAPKEKSLKVETKPEAAEQSESTQNVILGLSTREKLIILAEAENAGFLPTTHEEKNMVLTYLDYIHNPEFELGTQSQLIEVGNFHGKHHDFAAALEFSKQAGRSIAYEFADWYYQSSEQLNDLMAVKRLLKETENPNLSLAVALHVDIQKAVPLIRYMDLLELRAVDKDSQPKATKIPKPRFDILRTRRNKTIPNQVPTKNKVLEDPYMGQRSEQVTKWLKMRSTQIKVSDVRELIKDAIRDQKNRVQFHKLVLEDLAEEKTDSVMLLEASKVAQATLGRDT